MAKVIVAMSGGVDSSYAAFELKRQGFEVEGVTMIAQSESSKASEFDVRRAKKVCDKLGIKHHVLDYKVFFKNNIVEYFIDSYLNARTPNPCIHCNRILKFGKLFDWARNELGADFYSTGHYVEIVKESNNEYFIKKGNDSKKDQSYFLSSIRKEVLPYLKFPCANIQKSEIIKIIKENDLLEESETQESFDICFVPDDDYKKFIKNNVNEKEIPKGNFLDEDGNQLRENEGIINYTIGQRRGIGFSIGKKGYIRNIYKNGDVEIGDRPYITGVVCNAPNLFTNINNFPDLFEIKIRYKNKGNKGFIKYISIDGKRYKFCDVNPSVIENSKTIDRIEFEFEKKCDASAPGQYVVVYVDNRVFMGGEISDLIFEK